MSRFHAEPTALRALGKAFEQHGADLASQVRVFTGRTGGEVIHDGFGVLTESEELTGVYIGLSEEISETLEKLALAWRETGQGLTRSADEYDGTEDSVRAAFGGGCA